MVIDILKSKNALLEGHFILSSGRHSDKYCQCAKLFEDPKAAEIVVAELASKIKHLEFDTILGPAMGGIIAAYELSRQTGTKNIFSERVNSKMELRRGFSIKKGERVIICEDVVTTYKSSLEVAHLIQSFGGIVVAIVSIVDRSVNKIDYETYSAVKLQIESYDESECPLCSEGIKAVKPGSRFL